MVVQLPRASPSSVTTGGGRAVRLPDAGDVPQVQLAGDPGVRVSSPDFSGVAAVGRGLESVSQDVLKAERRQQSDYDATQVTNARLAFDELAMTEFRRRQIEDDPGRPDFMADMQAWLDQRARQTLTKLPQGVSATGRATLTNQLAASRLSITNSAGRLSIKAGSDQAQDAISGLTNQLAAQAAENPLNLRDILKDGKARMEPFLDSMTADAERESLADMRATIIETALESMTGTRSFGAAQAILASEDFDEDITPEIRERISDAIEQRRIDSVTGTVTEWFKGQPDRYGAAQQIFDGEFDDPAMQALYDSVPVEARSKIFRGAVDDASKLATFRNQERAEVERIEKQDADEQVKRFFFDEDLTAPDRANLFQELRPNPEVPVSTLQAMETFVREGEVEDVEADVFQAEAAIRREDIRDTAQLIERMGAEGWDISVETLRTRLTPMIESQRDETFRDVLRWGQSELGIISGQGLFGDFFKDPVNKAAKYEAALRRFQRDNPTGDLWSHAEKIVPQINRQGNAAAAQTIPTLATAYRSALASGDPRKIADARSALITVMVSAAMVEPLEAARGDFDPLTIIDKPRE